MMPASGGMGGVSISQPQDVLSALHGNPATLRQYTGTNFTFSGGWLENTYNLAHNGDLLPGIDDFSAKSSSPGIVVGNIGVSQEFTALEHHFTSGVALVSAAGASVDFTGVPESNASASSFYVLEVIPSVGMDLTERLSAGVGFGIGLSTLDGPFTGISKNTPDYAVRATFGLNYELQSTRSIGAYFHTEESFTYEDAVILELFNGNFTLPEDLKLQLPASVGIGVADRTMMNGRLLAAADIVYRFYENADFFRELFDNQLAIQLGAQYHTGRYKLRIGYVWAENLLKDETGSSIGGIGLPGEVDAVQYIQAQFAAIAKNRISAGIGIPDIFAGIDLDLFVGGMFKNSQQLGESFASIESYWLGGGLTWHFRPVACCENDPSP
jgi:long-chain fatty acid transport protein